MKPVGGIYLNTVYYNYICSVKNGMYDIVFWGNGPTWTTFLPACTDDMLPVEYSSIFVEDL